MLQLLSRACFLSSNQWLPAEGQSKGVWVICSLEVIIPSDGAEVRGIRYIWQGMEANGKESSHKKSREGKFISVNSFQGGFPSI